MICSKCGTNQEEGRVSCQTCGAILGQVQTQAQSPATGSIPKTNMKALIIGGIAVISCIVIVFVSLGVSGAFMLGQTKKTFRQALLESPIVINGIASDAYLNESSYQLVQCDVDNLTKINKKTVTATIFATIENRNFTTEMELTAIYVKASNDPSDYLSVLGISGHFFEVVSSTSTPKKGIDHDENRQLGNIQSVLNEDGMSCDVGMDKDYHYWFADSIISDTYKYRFNGRSWVFESENTIHKVTYKDIDGEYAAKTGSFTELTQFSISDLDSQKGTFTIRYIASPFATRSTYSTWGTYPDVSGTMKATIDPIVPFFSTNKLDDGYAYYFEARGNSDRGDGQAYCNGYFILTDSGEPAIFISDCSIDCISVSDSGAEKNRDFFLWNGRMFKQ